MGHLVCEWGTFSLGFGQAREVRLAWLVLGEGEREREREREKMVVASLQRSMNRYRKDGFMALLLVCMMLMSYCVTSIRGSEEDDDDEPEYIKQAKLECVSYPRVVDEATRAFGFRFLGEREMRIHIVGADEMDHNVNWHCDQHEYLLVGVHLNPDIPTRSYCAAQKLGLYSSELVGGEKEKPDAIFFFNAPLYTCSFRRTLWNILNSDVPVVATFQSEDDGKIIERFLENHEATFNDKALAECDSHVKSVPLYAKYVEAHSKVPVKPFVKPPKIIWPLVKTGMEEEGGKKNLYWLAFRGRRDDEEEFNPVNQLDDDDDDDDDDEL